jgi:ABC-2 type transport system permease protein
MKKELKSYFSSPVAYIVAGIFLSISGYFFYNILTFFTFVSLQYQQSPYAYMMRNINMNDYLIHPLYSNLGVILLFVIPMITMRTIAEEKKLGTVELLYTSPVRISEIIAGKFLAAFVVFLVMLIPTIEYPIALIIWGAPGPEVGPIITTYIGLILLAASFISVGIFASSVTENQMVAGSLAFGILLLLFVLGWAKQTAGSTFGEILGYISLVEEHYQDFLKGMIDSKDFVYYLTFIFFGLFLAHRSMESRRWR